jgi:hypothetical protein
MTLLDLHYKLNLQARNLHSRYYNSKALYLDNLTIQLVIGRADLGVYGAKVDRLGENQVSTQLAHHYVILTVSNAIIGWSRNFLIRISSAEPNKRAYAKRPCCKRYPVQSTQQMHGVWTSLACRLNIPNESISSPISYKAARTAPIQRNNDQIGAAGFCQRLFEPSHLNSARVPHWQKRLRRIQMPFQQLYAPYGTRLRSLTVSHRRGGTEHCQARAGVSARRIGLFDKRKIMELERRPLVSARHARAARYCINVRPRLDD